MSDPKKIRDVRSQSVSKIDLKPLYSGARPCRDAENLVRFGKKWEKKVCPISKNGKRLISGWRKM